MLIFASKLYIKKMKINLLIFLLTMFTALSCTHKKSYDGAANTEMLASIYH